MTRRLRDLSPEERAHIAATVHREAEEAGWHTLSAQQKGSYYDEWTARFDVSRPALKDGLMKGFDAAQGHAPGGEAAVHYAVVQLLSHSPVPYWGSKVSIWAGRGQADFVLGFSAGLLTHIAELEPAPTWRSGLTQALWYKSAYLHESRIQAIPTLILFGRVTGRRWDEIATTCLDQRVLVLGFQLEIVGREGPPDLRGLLVP